MLRVSLREIRAHGVRFALSVLAVILGVAFVAGTFILRAMLSDTFDSIVESSLQGDAYLRSVATTTDDGLPDGPPDPGAGFGGARDGIDIALADEVAAVDGVARALPDVQGPIVIVGADGTAVVNGQAPSLALALHPDDPAVDLIAGEVPVGPNEIGLESGALDSSGLALGDTTTVVLGGEVREVTVVAEGAYASPTSGATLAFLDADVAADLFAPDGLVNSIAVYGDDGVSQSDLVDAITDTVLADHPDANLEARTGDDVRAEASEAINEIIGFIGTFLLVFASIALFVGAFIITNTFAMSVRQRQREYALLRALGASPAQVFTVVLTQAFAVGLVGSAVGLLSGVALVDLIRWILSRFGMNLTGEAPVTAFTAVLCLGIGTLVSLVAAAVPARRAALTAPVEAMRDDVTVTEKSLRWRALAGAVLLLIGVAATYVSVAVSTDEDPYAGLEPGPWLGIGAGAVLVGMLALSPVIARATLGVLAAPFVAAIKPLGRLARGNVMRNPRRTASTAGALMIGMALVAACTVLAASARESTTAIVETEYRADFVVLSATNAVPAEAVAAIADLDDVARADALSTAPVELSGPGLDPTSTTVIGAPPAAFGTTLEIETLEGDLATLADGEAALQTSAALEYGWQLGDEITLRTDVTELTLTVGAITNSQALNADVTIGEDQLAELLGPAPANVVMVGVDGVDGVPLTELRDQLDAIIEPYVVVTALTADELVNQIADQVNQALVIIYALLALSVVIAVLGIVNTLALSVIERTREIGLIRAVGLGRLQLSVTIVIESVLTAIFGTVVGVVVGVALAAAVRSVFADQGLSVLAIPWDQLAAIVALSAVVGVLAAVWPAIRASRLPVLEAIAQE
ncbi:ABC transporter permease [Occultella aeris]|uniref:Macrolide export ATP-binding/permease protein MacB n=1 Tax=Occultella aeris TaxID=2761496 RepID=A0A7M4DFT1_9MICO|nr:FtsX-like permease family protein [Occultella aeris]VZO35774.1 Macrolide export ATP-binding/permease protein MacB [Occultella aeris]